MQVKEATHSTNIQIFADTNVILEAFRTHCWAAISKHFSIVTVDKCVEETLTGNPTNPRHIPVSATDLKTGLAAQYAVTRKQLATLVLTHPICSTLDDGEQHLLAWLLASELQPSLRIAITTADKAALIATYHIGWLDYTWSLENLARSAGVSKTNIAALALQYRDNWLSGIKTKIRLGVMP